MFLILLALGITACAALKDNGFRCDYTYVEDVQGWLKYHEIPATWHDARLRCYFEGAVLASPLDYNLQRVMLSVMTNRDIFIGYHATFSKGDYFSVEGVPLGSHHPVWVPGEPDNWENSEDCLFMSPSGGLGDMNCKRTRPYICYKKYNDIDRINECGTIDKDYHLYNSTGSCYKFHRVPRRWSRAFMACAAEGGHLTIINSNAEVKVIQDVFAKNPESTLVGNFLKFIAFIGFHDWGEPGDFLTIQGQTLKEAGYDVFVPDTPNNLTTGQSCGSAHKNAELNDLWCEESYAFICEKKPDSLLC